MNDPSSPLVAVIVPCVPCYNHGHFLPEIISSLQHQQYQNRECIVVDNGSKDATLFSCSIDVLNRPWMPCAVAGANFHYNDADDATALVRAHATNMVNKNPRMREARIAMRLKASTPTAVARNNNTKAINTHNLLTLISQDDFQQLYKGKVLLGVNGVLTKMMRWKNYNFFVANGLYWFSQHFRND